MFNFLKSKEFSTGQTKPMEDVTLQDMQEYPIWTFALDEEGIEGQDETWQKPIFSIDVKKEYIDVYILLKMESTNQYVSANLDVKKMSLSDIAVWDNLNVWISFENLEDIQFPIYLTSVPTIKGESNVKFIVNDRREKGQRVK